jgi:hypothetical protein
MNIYKLIKIGFLSLIGIIASLSVRSADLPVDLELALGVDVSGSIDDEEARLQRDGYIKAFRHPRIWEAVSHGQLGRIAVVYYEWAGFDHNKVVAKWALIDGRASALAFADQLTKEEPETASRTAISSAIDFGIQHFESNGFEGRRRVIDISGDGPNNWGELVTSARDRAIAQGITINGLPIMNERPSPWGLSSLKNLDLYYRHCVIGGKSAFIVTAKNFNDFARAVFRKLVLEIANNVPDKGYIGAVQLAQTGSAIIKKRVPPPCNIGEMNRLDREDY